MNTAEIKSDLHQKIEGLNPRQLNEVFGLFQNYLNGTEDSEQWEKLGPLQQKIEESIKQADAGKTRPLNEVTSRLRKKYNLVG